MIKNIEMYKNGEKWVVAWIDDALSYPQRSKSFFSEKEAKEFQEKLENYYEHEQEAFN